MDLILISVSCIISCFIIIIAQKYFLHNKYIDEINNRSSHSSLATRSGGVSLFLTLFLISVYFYLKGFDIYEFSLLVPLSLLMVVGLYDDVNGIDFKLKFIFQIIAAKIIIDNGLIIDNLHGLFGVYELSRITAQLLTIFIIVAIINSINFIDGIDGLAITTVILFIIGFEFFASDPTSFTNLSNIIIGSLVPIYYFNFRKKNKVFLGDSGSLFLGGVISMYVIRILTNNYIIQPEFDLHKILFVISILFYPIIDIIRIFFLRLIKGKSPFIADKNHIHHLILSK
ncbi:MAG: undecaprenyl/decaprenyl-phosphate alpha-N-acetylglucosaminyl 1-phosphate transferase, partial [Flavobacteriaceae bacterium]|nr:undecaprenyl/decaprenyl-phosphate alpha-N-acetylglucosaminyl 1-phosphate transferase [Flavobacteriaceae bacterium]